jgi:hypothetical protein
MSPSPIILKSKGGGGCIPVWKVAGFVGPDTPEIKGKQDLFLLEYQ